MNGENYIIRKYIVCTHHHIIIIIIIIITVVVLFVANKSRIMSGTYVTRR